MQPAWRTHTLKEGAWSSWSARHACFQSVLEEAHAFAGEQTSSVARGLGSKQQRHSA